MKVKTTFLILNENNENKRSFLRGYETNVGWFKEIESNGKIFLKRTTPEEITLLNKKLQNNMKETQIF